MDNQDHTINQPIVPVSDQPLTLDPASMTEAPTGAASSLQSVAQTPQLAQQPSEVGTTSQDQSAEYPVGRSYKEGGPIPQASHEEYIRPTEVVLHLHPEVKEAGVEAVVDKEQPQLTQEHKAVGIEYAKESVPVTTSQQVSIHLPYTPLEAREILKTVPPTESKHWLAVLTDYIIKKLRALGA